MKGTSSSRWKSLCLYYPFCRRSFTPSPLHNFRDGIRKQRSKKEISYQIISDAPIASISKGFEKRVTIQLDGKPVKDVRQVVIKIRNSGNAAVKRDDYDKQLKFIFEGSEIIGGDVLSTE